MNAPGLLDFSFALLINAALLLGLVQVVDLALPGERASRLSRPAIVAGLLVGGIGILLIRISATLMPGVIFDTRSVLLAVSGLFLGPVPTAIGMAMTAGYRWMLGGAAVVTGIAVILASGLIGLAWRRALRRPVVSVGWRGLYALGIAIHLAMLALMLLMPWDMARAVLARISLPVMLIHPLLTLALGLFCVDRLQRRCDIAELHEREERYRALFENSHTVMLIVEPEDGAIVDANAAAVDYYGWTRERLKTMHVRDINPLTAEEIQAEMRRALSQQRQHFEFRHRRADGSLRDVEVFSGPLRIGGHAYLYSIVHDVAQRKAAEAALQESEARYRQEHEEALRQQQEARLAALNLMEDAVAARRQAEEALAALRESESFVKSVLDSLPIGIAVNAVSPAVNFRYMNDNFTIFYRTTREQLADPDAFWDTVYEDPAFREEIRQRVLEDCASGDPDRMHWDDVPISRDGAGTTYISARNIPLPDKGLMISLVWDVTERKTAEISLRRARDLNQRYLDTVQTLMLAIDSTGRITMINRFGCALLGYAEAELLGRNWFECCLPQPDGMERVFPVFRRRMASEPRMQEVFENPVRRRDGSVRLIAWHNVVLTDPEGRVTGMLSTGEDITERRRNEDEMRRQAEELASRNDELERFNQAMVGRELDMIELKRQLNALSLELGRPPPFDLAALTAAERDAGGGAP
jgi:PAS domain S-box-containing protein